MAYQVDYSPMVNASANRANMLTGLGKQVGGMIGKGLEKKRERKESAKIKGLAEKAMSGDTAAQDELAYTSPEINKAVMERLGAKTEKQQKAAIYDFSQMASLHQSGNQEATMNYMNDRISAIDERGGDSTQTKQIRDMYASNPEQGGKYIGLALQSMINPEEFAKNISGQKTGMEVAGIKEFEYLTDGLPEDQKMAARRIKLGLDPRASTSAEVAAAKEFATTSAKLQARYRLEPKVAAAVAAATNEAKVTADMAGEVRSNDAAWNVYNSSMSNLAKAMSGTETGPVVGFIPAVTANQQIAQGAVAVMAPVLKQMFRAAGEGVFTDKDQELLMQMVPTRKDKAEARLAKIRMIDDVVRAKLKMPAEGEEQREQPQSANVQELSDEELKALAFGGK